MIMLKAWLRPGLGLPLVAAAVLIACGDRASDTPETVASSPTSAASQATTAPAGDTTTPTARMLGPAEHDGARTMAHIEKLAGDIGPRVAGTAGEREAVEYIVGEFESSGYVTEIMEFPFSGDRFRVGSLESGGTAVDAIAMDGTKGGTVTAASVFIGLADGAGLAGKDVKGKIAVADRGTLEFRQKYEAAKAAGAVGLVILNNQAGAVNGSLRTAASFPVVAISGEDATAVRAAAQAGQSMTLSAPDANETKALNVIARPAANAHCEIIVGGHHDTVPDVPGATDNASGSATVIELARAFAADGLDAGLCFATFGAEESGLFGSEALVERLEEADDLPRFYLNLDVTGTGDALDIIGDTSLQGIATRIAAAANIPVERATEPAGASSDHASFRQAGVPVIYIASNDYSMIHTPEDAVGIINQPLLEQAGDLAEAVIDELLAQIARG